MSEPKKGSAESSRLRRQRWEQIVKEFEASGLTGASFCRERGIPAWQLSYWKNVLRKATASAPAFVELHLNEAACGVWVECGRWRVSVAGDFDAQALRRVVEALT